MSDKKRRNKNRQTAAFLRKQNNCPFCNESGWHLKFLPEAQKDLDFTLFSPVVITCRNEFYGESKTTYEKP